MAEALRLGVDRLAVAEGAALKLPEVVARQKADHAEHAVMAAAKTAAMVKICIGSIDMFYFMYNCIYQHDINWINFITTPAFSIVEKQKGQPRLLALLAACLTLATAPHLRAMATPNHVVTHTGSPQHT